MSATIQYFVSEMATKKKNYCHQMIDSQKRLVEMQKKLDDIKKRQSKMKITYRGKGDGNVSSQENLVIVKKEIELLERDLVFVKTWLESGNDSCSHGFTSRFMKRVLPARVCRDVSSELRLSILLQSIRFLQIKLTSLEAWTKRSKKKRSEDSFAPKDSECQKNKSHGSSSTEKCRLPSIEDSIILPDPLMDHSGLTNNTTESEHFWKYDVVSTDYSVINFDFLKKKKSRRKSHRSHNSENRMVLMERSVQTENNEFPESNLSIQSADKFVQTDGVEQVNVLSEIYEAFNKIMEEHSTSERSPNGSEIQFEDSISNDTSDLSMDRTQPQSRMTEILIPPLWMICLQDKMDLVVNSLFVRPTGGYDNIYKQGEALPIAINEAPAFSCKEIISLPIDAVGFVGHTKLRGQRWLQSQNYCLTGIWAVKETIGFASVCAPMVDEPTTPASKNESISIKVIRNMNRTNQTSRSLQIEYCGCGRNTGSIVLTESGSGENTTQSEILCRIVTYLLGLSAPPDKT